MKPNLIDQTPVRVFTYKLSEQISQIISCFIGNRKATTRNYSGLNEESLLQNAKKPKFCCRKFTNFKLYIVDGVVLAFNEVNSLLMKFFMFCVYAYLLDFIFEVKNKF